ncbi:MAG: YidC/Oxa1 family membrane protein insertase [Eubacteriales bacterium]|nr:YidC/Oxa1 family membrane protein insertase [Eubacteriales bacterium]
MSSIFDIINIPFGFLMRWFNEITGNYLLALLLFAIVVKLVLSPIAIKQQKNQIKQAKLRPLEMAIRKRYAGRNDKVTQQKMQQDVLELYQQQGYSPLSGCLPLLIQFPIIISLYNIIRKPLTYICDISKEGISTILEKLQEWGIASASGAAYTADEQISLLKALNELPADRFAELSGIENISKISEVNLSVLGGLDLSQAPKFSELSWLWLIPILTFVTSFIGTKISRRFMPQPGAAAGGQDAATSMKIMDFTMPLMSVFFTFLFPGAIGVYWIYQNVLNVAQTVLLAKLMPLPTFTEEDYKAAERQLNGKSPKKAGTQRDPNSPRPRSLHHIDDDDEPIPPSAPEPEEKEPNPDAPKLKDDEKEKYRNK